MEDIRRGAGVTAGLEAPAQQQSGRNFRPINEIARKAVGSDADLVIFDPSREFTIRAENQHTNVGYTLYEGRTVLGWPEMSLQRGKLLLKDGQILGAPGQAQHLPTKGMAEGVELMN